MTFQLPLFLALELKDHNITVNAYAPGIIETAMSMSILSLNNDAAEN
jgi:NAD(P)-dependent dehydrogenase (short-subunit alcohol dehydrogenase family)